MRVLLLAALVGCSDYKFAAPTEGEDPGVPTADDTPIRFLDQLDVSVPTTDTPDTGSPGDTGEDCEDGYTGWFYNLPASHPDVEIDISGLQTGDVPSNHDWWDDKYLAFTEQDPGLEFGDDWWPVDEGLPGDPQYFAVRWEAQLEVSEDVVAVFEMGSDDDSWAYIDGVQVADLGGIHGVEQTMFAVEMPAGVYELELFMAERHTSGAGFWFRWLTPAVSVYTCPE